MTVGEQERIILHNVGTGIPYYHLRQCRVFNGVSNCRIEVLILVPQWIAITKCEKLIGDNPLESWTDESIASGVFREAAGPKLDVVDRPVQSLEMSDSILVAGNLIEAGV